MDFFWTYLWPLIVMVAQSVMLLVILLVGIAYILLADRKIWAAVQMRRGPNVVGPWGLFQSFADLLKFIVKEPVIPAGANKGVFLLAPLVTCVLALSLIHICVALARKKYFMASVRPVTNSHRNKALAARSSLISLLPSPCRRIQ